MNKALESLSKKLPKLTAGEYFAMTGITVDANRWNGIRRQLNDEFSRKYVTSGSDILAPKSKVPFGDFMKSIAKT